MNRKSDVFEKRYILKNSYNEPKESRTTILNTSPTA